MQIQEQLQKRELKRRQIEGKLADFWASAKLRRDARNLAVFLSLLTAAVLGRVALQHVPSVEPIIPLAVLAGMLFGMKEGFTLGGSAYIISNFFVWGLQGPWTVFQALGAALAGTLGGAFGKLKAPSAKDLVIVSIAGTVIFEIIMNISGAAMGLGLAVGLIGLPLYFLTSLPFSAAHIATNAAFARLFAPLLKLRRPDDELKAISITRTSGGIATNVRMYRAKPE